MKKMFFLCCLLGLTIPTSVFACELADGKTLNNKNLSLSYKFSSEPIPVSQHFTIEVKICQNNQALDIQKFRIDATMPAHGHGMNYQASSKKIGPGHYIAEGLLLHMQGDWEFVIELIIDTKKQPFILEYSL